MDGGGGGKNSNSLRFRTFSWKKGIMDYHPTYEDIALIQTIHYPNVKKVISCWRVPLLNGHHLHTHHHKLPVQLVYRRCARNGERPYLNGPPS